MATFVTCGRWESATTARRYHDRTSPSPHGVSRIDTSKSRPATQSVNRSSAARSARSCSGVSRRLANGQ